MKFQGREIDPIRLWSDYVEFPPNVKEDGEFLEKVVCPNPAHGTLKRHFQINVRRPLVHCFAYCGISGSYEHAICMLEGLYEKFDVEGATNDREKRRRKDRAYRQARKIILKHATGKVARIRRAVPSSRNSGTATVVPSGALEYQTYIPQAGIDYLNERGITARSIAAFEIGWDSDETRIVIPAKDDRGKTRFLIKRAVLSRQHPKYLYAPEKDVTGWGKSDLLFGAGQIDLGMLKSDGLILVEGSLDAISLHQDGFHNAGAILGTGISMAQLRVITRLRPRKIFLWFDKDAAGIRNIEIAQRMLYPKYPLYVVRYPKGKYDPQELTQEEAIRAKERAISIQTFNHLVTRQERKVQVGY